MSTERRIEIVDDEAALRESTAFLLRAFGVSVRCWESPHALLQSDMADLGDCILLDLRMPEMSGFEVARELHRRNVGVPIILLTGHGDERIRGEALAMGIESLVEKPFQVAELLEAIEKAVGG